MPTPSMLDTDVIKYSRTLASRGNSEGALNALMEELARHPEDAEIWLELASLLCDLGRFRDAMTPLATALQCAPATARAYLIKGKLCAGRAAIDDAVVALRTAVTLEPTLLEGYLELARTLRSVFRMEEAAQTCREALEHHPSSALLANAYGELLMEQGALTEARALFSKALSQQPNLAEAHLSLALTCERLDDSESAIRSLESFCEVIREHSHRGDSEQASALRLKLLNAEARCAELREKAPIRH